MPARPDDPQAHDDAEGAAQRQHGRTLTAGREFLSALGSDVSDLGRRLGQAARRRRQRDPSIAGRPRRARFAPLAFALVKITVLLAFVGTLAFAGAMLWALRDLPSEKPIGGNTTPSLLLEAANGEALGRVGPLKMTDATRADIPDVLVKAVLSIEDRHFYSHWGFDASGIVRALRRNMAAGTIVEGGSTITQQLVKLRFLGHERTLPHKLREALVAMWLDVHLGKDEILTRYLNSVYLGNGAYGMSAAARLYFDKRLADLTLPEAAMLAGLIRSPSRENPMQNLAAAQARGAFVLDAMRDNGVIDAPTEEKALSQPATLHLAPQTLRAGTWFADWIAREATQVPGSFSGHVRLRTTVMPEVQKLAQKAVNDVLAAEGAKRHVSQAALVAMRPDGSVVAMVGGRDYKASQFNRAVDAQRQPGSSFKLFVYLAALRKGRSLEDTVDASSLDVKGWEPDNYSDRHYGRVTLERAFAESINTAAARLAQEVGLDQVINAARDLGVTSPLPAVPSLALGSAELSLLDLTAAYAAVRANKMPVKPWGIAGFGVEGDTRLQTMGPLIGGTRPLEPYQKPLLTLLQAVVQRGTGRAAALDGFSAGKTGTSQNFRDAWFIGFNDTLVTGVWVGNDDGSPTEHVTGGSLPAAIWKRFMTEATPIVVRGGQPAIEASRETPAPSEAQAPATQAAQCDYQACARNYSSFRPEDCTYQPYGESGRRLCERKSTQRTAATPAPQGADSQGTAGQEATNGRCNVDACASKYSSFDPGSCTYQPYDGGPRRLCEKK
jgi:penicillin-binding protein 1A